MTPADSSKPPPVVAQVIEPQDAFGFGDRAGSHGVAAPPPARYPEGGFDSRRDGQAGWLLREIARARKKTDDLR